MISFGDSNHGKIVGTVGRFLIILGSKGTVGRILGTVGSEGTVGRSLGTVGRQELWEDACMQICIARSSSIKAG